MPAQRSLPWGSPGDLRVRVADATPPLQVYLEGELDVATAARLRTVVDQHLDGTRQPVQLDLSGLAFCDASGLTALLELHQRLRADETSLTLVSPTELVRRLLVITRLDEVFELA